MAQNSWFLCASMAILGFTTCGIIWLVLSHPELIVSPDIDRSNQIVYWIGRNPWAFPITMAVLGRFAVHVLFEVKTAPETPSSKTGVKSRARKESYYSSESQRLWSFRLQHMSVIIAVMVVLCFDNLTTRFPPETLEPYVWVWAIFGPALPFLTLFFFFPFMEMSKWRRQRARLGVDNVDAEKGYADSSDENEDDDGATTDTEKQHVANNYDRGKDKPHHQNTSRYSTHYSNAEKECTLKLFGLSMLIWFPVSTGLYIFFHGSSGRAMNPYMWICYLFGPPVLPFATFLSAFLYFEWSRWRYQRAQLGVYLMDAGKYNEKQHAAYTDDEGKVDEKESGL